MVDRNNLNRIKGILSARQGAEIPKFQNPAGPMLWNGQGDKEIKFHKKKGYASIYSHDGLNWFQDIGLAIPYTGSLDGYVDTSLNIGVKPPLEITGANPDEGNPNAEVESAAKVNTAVNEQQVNQTVANTVQRQIEKLPEVTPIASENKVISTAPTSKEVFDKEVQQYRNDQMSAGMNLKEGQVKQTQDFNKVDQIVSGVVTTLGNAVGAKQLYTDSNLTKGLDTTYDAVAGIAENFGPIGKAVSTAMHTLGAAGDLIQEMGGGTDQQTKMDKWMDSSFFSWNIGMLNGFAGKNTDSFGVDQNTIAQVGSSYGGTVSDLNDAASRADKKYGLFSSKDRKKANAVISTAKGKQNLMGNIADDALDQRLLVQSMGEQAGLAYSMMTDGGYNQKYTYAAKQGGLLEWNPVITLEWEPQVELNWELPTFKEGGNIEITEELEWIPEFKSGGKTRSLEDLIEYAKKENPRFIQRLSEEPRGITFTDDSGNEVEGSHLMEWGTDDSGNAIVYPRIQEMEDGSLQLLSTEDAYTRAINTGNFLIMSKSEAETFFAEDKEFGTAYKRGWPQFFKSFKKGGSVGESDVPETEETSQKNVIPEGALHKNKHHMEHAEGLTKKGIPVIDDDGEQQAEIEHSEIIFTLEVTKKLEEYYEIFYSDESSNKEKEQAAIDAGKLLVFQILENTEDRTGLIESCKKGGTITLKTTTDDIIDEVLEWMPTVIVVEEKEVEEKPKKKEEKSDKELMKEAIKEVLIELLTK